MENHLLNASLRSRDTFYLVLQYITVKDYSREFQIIMGKVKEYYDRDNAVPAVNREIFLALLEESITNKKHLERFSVLIDQALLLDTSVVNINDLIVRAKLHEVGMRLSTALANKEDEKARELMTEYQKLQDIITLEELESQGTNVLTAEDMDWLLEAEGEGKELLKIYPLALNERLENRAGPGHHIVTMGRPEAGKSTLNFTMAGGFARQGAEGIMFENEDRDEDTYMRLVSNITGMDRREILTDKGKARRLAMDRGLGNVRIITLSPGNPRQIEAFVEKYKPRWFIMNQIRNLYMKETNKVLQLEYATSAMRNLAKKYECIGISTTQAGESAEGKRLLTMSDCDYSNTGVAAQADVLAGLGGTYEDMEKGIRFINLSKNKLTGRHEAFPVRIVPSLSRYISINSSNEEAS